MIYLSYLDIHIVLGITSSTCWGQRVDGGCWHPRAPTRHQGSGTPGTPSSLETQTTMIIRCPAECEAGSSVGKWAIITITWNPLSCGLLSMSYKWIQLAGSYLNATICDMHLFKFSYKPHSKWEDQLFIFCQLRWTVSNSFSVWPLSFDIWKWFLQNLWNYLFLSPRMLWTFYLSGFYPILS